MAATNQSVIIAALQSELGAGFENYPYEGLWHALWNDQSIDGTNYDERLLNWINGKLTTSYTNLPKAMQAFAEDAGFYNWDSMTTFDASAPGGGGGPSGDAYLLEAGDYYLLETGDFMLIE